MAGIDGATDGEPDGLGLGEDEADGDGLGDGDGDRLGSAGVAATWF